MIHHLHRDVRQALTKVGLYDCKRTSLVAGSEPSRPSAFRSSGRSAPRSPTTREALEQHLGDQVRASLHVAEGISAFREKRQPCYE